MSVDSKIKEEWQLFNEVESIAKSMGDFFYDCVYRPNVSRIKDWKSRYNCPNSELYSLALEQSLEDIREEHNNKGIDYNLIRDKKQYDKFADKTLCQWRYKNES